MFARAAIIFSYLPPEPLNAQEKQVWMLSINKANRKIKRIRLRAPVNSSGPADTGDK
jgi:hypothetical protein